jgi:hypothetical protein
MHSINITPRYGSHHESRTSLELPQHQQEGAPLHVTHAASPFVHNIGTIYVFITAYARYSRTNRKPTAQ